MNKHVLSRFSLNHIGEAPGVVEEAKIATRVDGSELNMVFGLTYRDTDGKYGKWTTKTGDEKSAVLSRTVADQTGRKAWNSL